MNRSAWERRYDDVFRWREDARMSCFAKDLLKALQDPRILDALPEILREAHKREAARVHAKHENGSAA